MNFNQLNFNQLNFNKMNKKELLEILIGKSRFARNDNPESTSSDVIANIRKKVLINPTLQG